MKPLAVKNLKRNGAKSVLPVKDVIVELIIGLKTNKVINVSIATLVHPYAPEQLCNTQSCHIVTG
jgi:hypothetical protein